MPAAGLLAVSLMAAACSVDSRAPTGAAGDRDGGASGSGSGTGGGGSGGAGLGGAGLGGASGGAGRPGPGSGACPEGTTDVNGDGSVCEDIDECADGLDDCDDDPQATCINAPFTFRCACPPGTSDPQTQGRSCLGAGGGGGGSSGAGGGGGSGGTGGGGVPVDECAEGTDDCDDDPEATCRDLFQGYSCTCPRGYQDVNGDGSQCDDIDECEIGSAFCDPQPEATCMNLEGSYTCVCPDGFYDPDTNGFNCVDLPECSMDLDDCDDSPVATCTETTGSYACACPSGYEDAPSTLPGHDCIDVNECMRGTDLCDDAPVAACNNTPGSYTCTCPFDFQDPTSLGRDCQPIDQCAGATPCDDVPDACVDGIGTYTCECPVGYTDVNADGTQCNDVDECALQTDQCDDAPVAACANTVGGYTCTCPDGTVDVLGNGRHCVPPEDVFALGSNATCAIQVGGIVKCWGSNGNGQLGLGLPSNAWRGNTPQTSGDNLTPTDLGGPAIAVAAGGYHMCALLADGGVKCWGRNISDPDEGGGQLGQGHTETIGDQAGEMGDDLPPVLLGRPAIAISAGYEFSCALLDDDSLKCWGGNRWGQLGQGHQDSIGDAAGEMAALQAIELGGPVTEVQCGYRFMCARLGGQLKCWGRGEGGRLGQGDDEPRCVDPSDTLPNCPSSGVKTVHRGDEPDEMGDFLLPLPLGTGLDAVSSAPGFVHACASLSNGGLKCWGGSLHGIGYGEYGTTPPDDVNRGDDPNEMGDNLPLIDLPGTGTPVQISSQTYTCVVLTGGKLACFGDNTSGQLGLGDTQHRSDAPGEMGDNLPFVDLGTGAFVIAVRTGPSHACALLDTGALKCWGDNAFGQLDYGDTQDRGDQPGEMGSALGTSLQLW